MRRCGPAKQCLWVGPRGYLSRSGRQFAYAYTHAYSDSFGITHTESTAWVTYADTYGYGDGDSYAEGNTKVSADPASSSDAIRE
jgi:hypothetical protein